MDIDLVNQNLAKADLSKVKNQIEAQQDKGLKEKQLRQATDGLEAIFLQTLLKTMRNSLPGNAIFKESNELDIYKSMHDQYLAEDLSKGNSSIGLSEFLFNQLRDSI